MTDLEERLVALVDQAVTPVLKPAGYRKRKLEWVRADGGIAHRITLQRSHGNAPGHLRFYVDVGAYVADFARRVGATVAEDPATGTEQYTSRFEEICDWPGQWIDLEAWSDADLHPAFRAAIETLAAHLATISGPEELAAVLRTTAGPLNLELFAWSCANGDATAVTDQVRRARERFGAEDRWPRLYAQFERVAERFGTPLPD